MTDGRCLARRSPALNEARMRDGIEAMPACADAPAGAAYGARVRKRKAATDQAAKGACTREEEVRKFGFTR